MLSCCMNNPVTVRAHVTRPPKLHEFAIVLNKEDFGTSCFILLPYVERVKKLAKQSGARIHIIVNDDSGTLSKCKCCNDTHHLPDFFQTKTLYIKLPKENIYVPAEEWSNEFMKSKNRELMDIFMYLGAKQVEFTIHNTVSQSNGVSAMTSLSDFGIQFSTGLSMESANDNTNTVRGKIVYGHPTTRFDKFDNKNNDFFYLNRNHDWRSLVEHRIKAGTLNHIMEVTNDYNILHNFFSTAKLDKLGIQYATTAATSTSLRIQFNVEFVDTPLPVLMSVDEA